MPVLNITARFNQNYVRTTSGFTALSKIAEVLEESDQRVEDLCDSLGLECRPGRNGLMVFGISRRINAETPREEMEIVKHAPEERKVFFITSASARAKVHLGFLEAIGTFCSKHNAELVILPGMAHCRALESQPAGMDPRLLEHAESFATEYRFNKWLYACDAMILPQQVNPLTGMGGHGTKDQSVIVASPKQHLETVATANMSIPKLLVSTGSCTLPDYRDNRIGRLARNAHTIGGVIVELNGQWFHVRHVQAFDDGSFITLGVKYLPNGETEAIAAEGLILGDIHIEQIDEQAIGAWVDLADRVKPKAVVFHDLWDGMACNPHDNGRAVNLAQKAPTVQTLEVEMKKLERFCLAFEDCFTDSQLFAVASNHDDFLLRWLNAGQWVFDAKNAYFAASLFRAAIEGKNPLSVCTTQSKMKWLHPNDEMIIGGFNCSNHGHKGVGGTRGSAQNFRNTLPHVIGHSHVPKVTSNVIQVGCSCKLRQSYNTGLSAWLHASAVLYGQDKWELVIAIEGKFTALEAI